MPKLYILDASNYIHRSFHAISNLKNSKGFPSNAAFGFSKMLIKFLREKKPEYIAICFDAKKKTFRHQIYNQYKENRPPMDENLKVQIPIIKQIVKAFNIASFEKEGFEADDLIGTIASVSANCNFEVVIVGGDKDFKQLLDTKISIWDAMNDKLTSKNSFVDEFKIMPSQVIELMALSGDSSDNIPGVKGVGQKRALELIQNYHNLDNLYENIENITQKKLKENLINDKENAYLSKELVTIKKDVPLSFDIESCRLEEKDKKALFEIFKELEFHQLLKDISLKQDQAEQIKKDYKLINNKKDFEELLEKLKEKKVFAIDTETDNSNPVLANLIGISISYKEDEAFYIPLKHKTSDAQLDFDFVLEKLKEILENQEIAKIGQNIKYDKIVLLRYNIDIKNIYFDTMLASYLINPSSRQHSLKNIALELFSHQMTSYDELTNKDKIKFEDLKIEDAKDYSCADADFTFKAYLALQKMLKKLELDKIFNEVEILLIDVLCDMERVGIGVDKDALISLSKEFYEKLNLIQKEIFDLAGEKFNLNSPKQLRYILFEKLNLPPARKTKKKQGYSTDNEVLVKLAQKYDIASLLLEYRSINKLKSSYTDSLLFLINPKTKRVHSSFNQTITATGRLSSSSPNLQNIPIKSEDGKKIRKAFVAKENHVFISADYSQIELRILAHMSEDEKLISAFKEDKDIHQMVAEDIFQILPGLKDENLRRQAKTINFGIVYGISPFGLASELGITQKMAKLYIDQYFEKYKGVKNFIEKTINDAKKNLFVKTPLGRIRLLPQINDSNQNIRKFNERAATNMPIQGFSADIIKLAMIELFNKLKEKNLKTKILLSVHDELLLEAPDDEVDSASKMLKSVMENIVRLKTPLKVNLKVNKRWE